MQSISEFYSLICCNPRPFYPTPYVFDFSTEERLPCPQFQTNSIRTTKYNLINFLPKSIAAQYQRLANLYFLIVATINTIPSISLLNPSFVWAPLAIVLLISIIKQAYQDFQRYKMDQHANDVSETQILRQGRIERVKWKDVVVGDLCYVKEGELFPADLVLLSCSDQAGVAYIETATLDGEQTSKIRYAFPEINNTYRQIEDLNQIKGRFEGEIPSRSLDNFTASLLIQQHRLFLTDNKQLLFRGTRLKSTKWVWGLIVYTGQCSKIMLNGSNYTTKLSSVESKLNYLLVIFLIVQLGMCITMAIFAMNNQVKMKDSHFYLHQQRNVSRVSLFWTFFFLYFIQYSSLIPISLIVSIEIAKLAQSYFIDFDQLMFSAWREKKVHARMAALNEELGQVEFIFTDKTGTLTKNKMCFQTAIMGNKTFEFNYNQANLLYYSDSFEQFRRMNGNKQKYELSKNLQFWSKDRNAKIEINNYTQLAQYYLLALLFCNSVTVTPGEAGQIAKYDCQSPDELAFIHLVKSLGFVLVKRNKNSVVVSIRQVEHTVKILAAFPFTSDRKRMSVIVQWKDKIILFIKGADCVITERINHSIFHVNDMIDSLSKKGLRTLMMGMKVLSDRQCFQIQSNPNIDKDPAYADKFQNQIELLGAAGLLDELQDGVADTLNDFRRANIKVWMLTGDKLETAVEIGKSCKLIMPRHNIVKLNNSKEPIEKVLQKCSLQMSDTSKKHVLVIQGCELARLLQNEQIACEFAQISASFSSVICCRLLPAQKAEVVKLIRQKLNKICLAVGDGGNDVSMIKEANIGIGVYGQEGMNAVQASDYAIPQFRMLWRLLFVHGRWNYMRICEMILYFCYKSVLLTIPRFLYSFYNGFSCHPLFDAFYLAMYNIMFTSLPLLVRALFQQDVTYVCMRHPNQEEQHQSGSLSIKQERKYLPKGFDIKISLRKLFPKIYFLGQQNQIFNYKGCALWIIEAIVLGVAIFFITMFIVGSRSINQHGYSSDQALVSIVSFTIVILLDTIKLCIEVRHWTKLLFFSIAILSLAPYLSFMWIVNFYFQRPVQLAIIMSFTSLKTYLVVILTVLLAVAVNNIMVNVRFTQSKILQKMLYLIKQDDDGKQLNSKDSICLEDSKTQDSQHKVMVKVQEIPIVQVNV